MQLDRFDSDKFLSEYWQKKPLLIRNPWTGWSNPLEPDLLAGLACEEDVESRLVVRSGDTLTVENGPLAPDRFNSLGAANWTLLVQAVDHFDPAVTALIEPFRFIPDWRIDDVMVSYAADGGGVGAHFDNYDVFLVQGLGRRRWRVGQMCDASSLLLPHDDLLLLAEFEPAAEYILEPGDMLYIPPGIAHEGTAIGPAVGPAVGPAIGKAVGSAKEQGCMTYSIGFRAPAANELLADFCDHLLEGMDAAGHGDARYADPDLKAQASPGEIAPAALDRLHAMVTGQLQDRAAFARWFGEFTSTPKHGAPEGEIEGGAYDSAMLLSAADQGAPVTRNPASRFAFIRSAEGALTLFADGRSYACSAAASIFAEHICEAGRTPINTALAIDAASRALLAALLERGSLVIKDDGE